MGRATRERPKYLGAKIFKIRQAFGFTLAEMLQALGPPKGLKPNSIFRYEQQQSEPPLTVLLRYARLANVIVDVLIDDELDLPPNLPSPTRHEGIPRQKPKARRPPAA